MRKAIKALRSRVGRVHREVTRKLGQLPEQVQPKARELLHRVGRILTQKAKDRNKLYALHAPEVECIAKGKARTPYEFSVKVTIATTLKEGLVVGCRSMPGNPYDGHTLAETMLAYPVRAPCPLQVVVAQATKHHRSCLDVPTG